MDAKAVQEIEWNWSGFKITHQHNPDEKLLDNQDLAFLLKVSYRTLQRYRSSKKLPFFMIGHKTYYRVNDVRSFVREHMDFQTYQEFDKKHPTDDKDKEPE